jgi:hypothetical protein
MGKKSPVKILKGLEVQIFKITGMFYCKRPVALVIKQSYWPLLKLLFYKSQPGLLLFYYCILFSQVNISLKPFLSQFYATRYHVEFSIT